MNNKTNSFSSAPIYYGYQNNNNLIQYYPNTNYTNLVTKKNNKKVTFNTDVVVYNVESYNIIKNFVIMKMKNLKI